MKKMIAKTVKGKEFIYNRNTAHSVPNASAVNICNALNNARWQLKDNEVWHIYEMGEYERDYTSAGYMSFGTRKGKIFERR